MKREKKRLEPEVVFEKLSALYMGEASEPYSEKVLTLAYEPLNVGKIESASGVGYIKGTCGDSIHVYIKTDHDQIIGATFLTDGCGATLACGSAVTELAKGKSCYNASKMTVQEVIGYLDGLPASHVHCAVLAIKALHKAIKNCEQKNSYEFSKC